MVNSKSLIIPNSFNVVDGAVVGIDVPLRPGDILEHIHISITDTAGTGAAGAIWCNCFLTDKRSGVDNRLRGNVAKGWTMWNANQGGEEFRWPKDGSIGKRIFPANMDVAFLRIRTRNETGSTVTVITEVQMTRQEGLVVIE